MKMKNIIVIFIGVLLAGLCGCADKFENSDRQEDYQDYAGFWSEGGISAKDIMQSGGTEFLVEISNGNELKGYLYSQQGSTERFAEIEAIICKIQDGECDYFFVDDGWGNSGTLHIQFVKDEIRMEVQDFVLADNNASGFGISGNYVLIREKEVPITELPNTLEQYAADWSEDKLLEEINKRKTYRDNCSYYGEVVDYMENVREVRDISIYTEPLFYTDMMFYTEEDFKEVPELILYLAKNEIYARHGYIFENEDLKNYFMAQLWYLPMTTGTEFEDAVFNECEKANLALLLKLLEKDGETERTVEDSSVNEIDSESQADSELSFSSAEESYKEVLLGNKDFISTDLQNRSLHLSDIKDVITDDDSITVTIPQFVIIDLDHDGEDEVVLWIQINGVSDYGFEILHWQEEAVYGYTLPYMAFINLKTDGTFMFSGGAADFGIGKLKFSENGYTVDKLYYSESQYDSNNELSVQYFANGIACSEEEWNHTVENQEEKDNVDWYSLTDDSINSVFASGF